MQAQRSTDHRALVRTKYPGIFYRPSSGKYVVTWKDDRGKGRKETCDSLAEALVVQGERRGSGAARSPINRERFADYAPAWLDTYTGRTVRGVGELAREDYARNLRLYLLPYFGGFRLADIAPPDVRDFIAGLERKGLAPSTIRKIRAPLSALFATAVEDGAVRSNPVTNVRVIGREDDDEATEVRALTDAELDAFLGAVQPEWRLFFTVLYQTGLRISEACGLTWGDVEFGAKPCVHVRSQVCRGKRRGLKSKSSRRTVPLSPQTARALWKQRAQSAPDAPVFASKSGTPLSASNVRNRVLLPAREATGLGWVTFHSFRHSCASILFENGQDIQRVQHWLGHENAAFTQKVYVHLRDRDLGEADFFDAPLNPDPVATGGDPVATEAPQPAATGRRLQAVKAAG